MDSKEILRFCFENGLLVDNEILNLFSETKDIESVKLIINQIKNKTNKKVLTKNVIIDNRDQVTSILSSLSEEKQKSFESLKIKLGLSIEISKEVSIEKEREKDLEIKEISKVRVSPRMPVANKKLEVKDFVKYFKSRLSFMSSALQERADLDNLVSINKISGNRQGISIIGIVSDKRVTKNKNILFEVEDLTGKIKVLINQNKPELLEKAEEIVLDSVIGIKGSGNNEIIFANDVVFPDSSLPLRKKGDKEECALFIGDLHFGSKLFLKENFLKFIDYLGGKVPYTPEVAKIKYLFLVGDIVTGVGNYPNQEKDLEIKDLEDQFSELAKLLDQIPKHIEIIISPGNHDGVRIMEPQPVFDEKYAWSLYQLENVTFIENPSMVNIGGGEMFSGFDVLSYHGFSFPYYANNVPSLIIKNGMNCPEEIMKYLLKNRHLAPTHASTQYYPHEEDKLFIKKIPDIFVSAHTHKCGVSYYNNILLISVSCWEAMTPYQEKFGNVPDHCKVPMFNLKTREVKILDFES